MPVALSPGARALFKACLTGQAVEDRFNTPYFYDELARKGLLTLAESPFRLTEEGEVRRWEFVPHPQGPSEMALALFRRLVCGERIEVCDENRSAYRELATAELMAAGHSFSDGDESIYGLTKLGFERKIEMLARTREAS